MLYIQSHSLKMTTIRSRKKGMKDKRKKDSKKKKVQEKIENKEYDVPVEETRKCVKNADASVYCDPEKDLREKEEADSEALPMVNTISVIKEKAGSEQTIT